MKDGKERLKVALIGNPNSGKTSLFNKLTGLHQKVGNFPGVTVEKKSGKFTVLKDGQKQKITLVDLPGTYSLEARSIDEKVAADAIISAENDNHPDLALIVVDALHIKTSLYLVLQVLESGTPSILVLNMADQLKKSGSDLDVSVLAKELGVPVVFTNAREGKGIDGLKRIIADHGLESPTTGWADKKVEKHVLIREILGNAQESDNTTEHALTKKIDDILTHRIWGIVFFLFLLGLMFQSIYSWSAYPMEWIERLFS
ncbi:MAG: FeoB small GTPase domain-containing protein, partial [Flavobacteriales bacterium]|nr:FeoB small GTPase domain-containing protein [Flavobacteriales bacterium]